MADLLIVAAGYHHLITADHVKEGVTILDVGINKIIKKDGKKKLEGDVDFQNVIKKAAKITPVPGGIGPMTCYGVAHNLYITSLFNSKTTNFPDTII